MSVPIDPERPLVAFDLGLETLLSSPVYPVRQEPFSLADLADEAVAYGEVEDTRLEGGVNFAHMTPRMPGVKVEVWCRVDDEDKRFVVMDALILSRPDGRGMWIAQETGKFYQGLATVCDVINDQVVKRSEFDIDPIPESSAGRLTLATLAMGFFNVTKKVAV